MLQIFLVVQSHSYHLRCLVLGRCIFSAGEIIHSVINTPHSLITLLYASVTSSFPETSTMYPFTLPNWLSSLTADDMLWGFISHIIRQEAPFSNAIRPIIFPIPEAPPVINTFAFSNFITTVCFEAGKCRTIKMPTEIIGRQCRKTLLFVAIIEFVG